MAASTTSRLLNICLNSWSARYSIASLNRVGPIHTKNRRCYCTGIPKRGLQFHDTEVQRILKKITGLNLEKIFRPKKKRLNPPTYSLLSGQKLKQLEENAKREAEELLQMPPVLDAREEINEVLSEDKTLAGLETAKLVFTDITYGVSERERLVVVRDPNGTLRKANWEERDRMMQIYFPRPHRQIEPPPLFQDENLQHVLDQERYGQLLDAACVQFEPDNADFIRVHRRVYDHIDKHHHHDSLRSTRHFGGMTYYLVINKRIECLMADMMERNLLGDAADLVRLYHMIHPDCRSASEGIKGLDEMDMIKTFVALDARDKGKLELLIQQQETGSHTNEVQQ